MHETDRRRKEKRQQQTLAAIEALARRLSDTPEGH